MKKLSLAIAVVAVASVLVVAALMAGFFGSKLGVTLNYTYKIVNTFPHDPTAFTEGLTFVDNALYESTGAFLSSAPSSAACKFSVRRGFAAAGFR